jgi:hypothetical protein
VEFTEEGSSGDIFMESGLERGTPMAGDDGEMFTVRLRDAWGAQVVIFLRGN